MGFRFRRTLRLLPGIKINLSKSGASVSLGARGAHVTVGHGQVRETVGVPGSGLSYTHIDKPRSTAADVPGQAQPQTRVRGSMVAAARGDRRLGRSALPVPAIDRAPSRQCQNSTKTVPTPSNHPRLRPTHGKACMIENKYLGRSESGQVGIGRTAKPRTAVRFRS